MDGSSANWAPGQEIRPAPARALRRADVAMVDERLTSFAVKSEQREAGHRGDYRRDPVDSLAAELILRDWLNTRRTG
jgi:putative Holliday junction resolvase